MKFWMVCSVCWKFKIEGIGITKVRPGNDYKIHENLHIYGKLEVNGQNQHPLYEFLKNECPPTINQIGKRQELMYDPVRTNDIGKWWFKMLCIAITSSSIIDAHSF